MIFQNIAQLKNRYDNDVWQEILGNADLTDFANDVLNKACFLIVMIGMSKKIKLDNVKFCLDDKIIEISCKEFAKKYELYAKKIKEDIFETAKEI